MSSYRKNDIEALLERLGLLKIIKKALEEISVAPAPTNENVQVIVLKNMVLDPEWFNRD